MRFETSKRIIGRSLICFALLPVVRTRAADADSIVRLTGVKGGLCVQLGGGDGEQTVRLAQGVRFLVHRLDNDAMRVAKARRGIESSGMYGPISVEHWVSTTLPYADNLVNLIVADDLMGISRAELMRVLCPSGAACVKRGDAYDIIRKPWPDEMDEWTHQWHGADGSLTSEDKLVGVPTGVQWLAGPMFAMAGRKSSTQSLVSAGGRNFYLTQNVPSNLDRRPLLQYLVARDAFNGLVLWTRPWKGPFVTGNGETNARMIAVGDRVYIVGEKDVAALDAATGRTVETYPAEAPLQSLLYCEGMLLLVSEGGLTAADAKSAGQRWHHAASGVSGVVAGEQRVVFLLGSRARDGRWGFDLACLDLGTGQQQWRISTGPFARGRRQRIAFLKDGYLGLQAHGALHLVSATDGKHLWSRTTDARPGKDYVDERFVGHFYQHGLVWMRGKTRAQPAQVGDVAAASEGREAEEEGFGARSEQIAWTGLDPATGEVKQRLESRGPWPRSAAPGKMGCQALVATDRFIIIPRQATFVDFKTGEKSLFRFARGGCGYGVVPANGLVYTHPHACGCFSQVLRGFLGLRSSGVPGAAQPRGAAARLEKGPGFGRALEPPAATREEAWPTCRHDVRRSGATQSRVPAGLRLRWTARIAHGSSSPLAEEWTLRVGNRITSPVVADRRAFVGFPDAHRLVAVDADTGTPIWSFTAGGRIDTPPTIHNGLCLFGAHDGWVYCLRAADGHLVWRFRAAPAPRRIVAYGQVESVWPVAGTVLVQDGLAYVAAGRAPEADGGIHVHALEPETGRVVWSTTVSDDFYGLCDYLVGDGERVYLSNRAFDPKTGRSQPTARAAPHLRGGKVGLLEASWTRMDLALRKHIQDWTYGDTSGQLLAFSPPGVFGYRAHEDQPVGEVFAAGPEGWSLTVARPAQIEALILAHDTLFVAGPVSRSEREAGGGFLWALSTRDGRKLGDIALAAPPVFDGLAAAYGRVYVATQRGTLLCFEGK